MPEPSGKLSAAQFEILDTIWDMGPPGGSVTAVWEEIAARRGVTRGTVLRLVDRLEKRGWLSRKEHDGILHYWPTADRDVIERSVMEDVVENFFGGSASHLVESLLGSDRVTPEEVQRMRKLLDGADLKAKGTKPKAKRARPKKRRPGK